MNAISSLFQALRLINCFWIPAGVFYFLRHAAFTGSLSLPPALSRILDTSLAFAAKGIFLAWIWGRITEILSGEEPAARFPNFKSTLTKTWKIAFATLLIPWAFHFILFMTTGQNNISPNLVATASEVFIAFWIAGQFFKIKYSQFTSAPKNTPPLSFATLLIGIAFLFLSLGLFYCHSQLKLPALIKPIVEVIAIQLYFLMFAFFVAIKLQAHPLIAKSFESPKTVILVNLPSGDIIFEVFSSLLIRTYPVFFAVLRALTPAEYRVIEYNRLIWHKRYFHRDALVAISCFTSNCSDAYRIAKEYRLRGCTVIMGGPHVSFFPDEALEFCDSVVVGPAESVWEDIVRDYENDSLKKIYHGSCPQQKLAKVHDYLMNAPVEIIADCLQTSRGCKFDCYFCANPAITGKIRMEKTVAEMISLIQKVRQKKKVLFFLDNNLYADPAYAKEFFRALIPLNLVWAGNISIDIARDEEAMQLLRRSGCAALLIGYEVATGSIEEKRGGKFALVKDYLVLTRKLKKLGIQIKAQFMFGFPDDSWLSLAQLWWFCFRLSPAFTIVSFMTPLPGTRFFEDSIRKGTIINPNWRAYDIYHQVVEHPRLGRVWLFRKAFTVVTVFFLITTSSFGRIFFLIIILVELLYFHASA